MLGTILHKGLLIFHVESTLLDFCIGSLARRKLRSDGDNWGGMAESVAQLSHSLLITRYQLLGGISSEPSDVEMRGRDDGIHILILIPLMLDLDK